MYRVLLIDDNIYDLRGIESHIDWEKCGCVLVGTALDGAEGYEKAVMLHPDIIITDVLMPVMNGIELVEKLSNTFDDIIYIYISCHDDFKYLQAAIDMRVHAYVLKPINIDELTLRLKTEVEKLNELRKKQETECISDALYFKSRKALTEKYLSYILTYDINENSEATSFPLDLAAYMNLGIDLSKRYFLATISIYCAGAAFLFNNSTYGKYYLTEIYQSLPQIKSNDYAIGYNSSTLVLLFYEKNHTQDEIVQIVENLQKNVSEKMVDSKVIAFVSANTIALSDIHHEAQRQQNILTFGYYDLNNPISIVSENYAEENFISEITAKETNDAVYSFLDNPTAEINIFIDRIYPQALQQSPAMLRKVTFQAVFSVNNFLSERNVSLRDIFDSDTVIWNKLAHFDTIINIRQWMTNILLAVRQYLDTQDKTPHGRIVSQIKNAINKNYASINVIDDAISPLGISMSYANKIFRKETQKSIFSYLIDTRITEAKKRLINTDMRINDIAQCVGYPNPTYFTTFFKKATSYTPKEFRLLYRKESSI